MAAAATAASLFSPTFAPGSSGPSNHSNASSRPLSPTPTAGLGGLGGLDGLAGLNLDPTAERPLQSAAATQNDRDARDRIRNVWDTFRERLGLSSRNATATGQSAGTTELSSTEGEGTGATPRMRPGELMLAEMARALNAGLGLAGRSDHQPTEPPTQDSATSDDDTRPPAPEAGFERFLLNLQADLRTVLSEGPPAGTEDAATAEATDGSSQPATAVVEDHLPSSRTDTPLQSNSSDNDDDDEDVVPPTDDVLDGTAPNVRTWHPRTPTPIPNPTVPHIVEPAERDNLNARIAADRRRPAVNLWRIYRFQPIPAPPSQNPTQAQSTSTAPITSEVTTAPTPSGTPAETGSTTPTMSPSTVANTAQTIGSQPAGDANVVVPVIVVGLQSVDTALGRAQANGDEPTLPHEDLQEAANDAGIQEDIFAAQDPANINSNGRPATPRGRSWGSRAANALRTLRPGRRTGSRGGSANDGQGSRTFLIYVIGGMCGLFPHLARRC